MMDEKLPAALSKLIAAAVQWRETDGSRLEFTVASGNLNAAVAEYLMTVCKQESDSGDWLIVGDFRVPPGEFLRWLLIVPDDWGAGDAIEITLTPEGLGFENIGDREDMPGRGILFPFQREHDDPA